MSTETKGYAAKPFDREAEAARCYAMGLKAMASVNPPCAFTYERWRHGGWYVFEVRYPSGAVGCVSRNYADRKWRIACDPRDTPPTFRNRTEAAKAEYRLVREMYPELTTKAEPPPCDIQISLSLWA
jgi:hypothetical protein